MILLYGLSVAWFVLAALLAVALVRQGDHHAAERELWRAERQVLQARALRPMPSARRPVAVDVEPEGEEPPANAARDRKMEQLRRLAAGLATEEPANRDIIPTDL